MFQKIRSDVHRFAFVICWVAKLIIDDVIKLSWDMKEFLSNGLRNWWMRVRSWMDVELEENCFEDSTKSSRMASISDSNVRSFFLVARWPFPWDLELIWYCVIVLGKLDQIYKLGYLIQLSTIRYLLLNFIYENKLNLKRSLHTS